MARRLTNVAEQVIAIRLRMATEHTEDTDWRSRYQDDVSRLMEEVQTLRDELKAALVGRAPIMITAPAKPETCQRCGQSQRDYGKGPVELELRFNLYGPEGQTWICHRCWHDQYPVGLGPCPFWPARTDAAEPVRLQPPPT